MDLLFDCFPAVELKLASFGKNTIEVRSKDASVHASYPKLIASRTETTHAWLFCACLREMFTGLFSNGSVGIISHQMQGEGVDNFGITKRGVTGSKAT